MRPDEGFDQLQFSELLSALATVSGQVSIFRSVINTLGQTSSRRVLRIELNKRNLVLIVVI